MKTKLGIGGSAGREEASVWRHFLLAAGSLLLVLLLGLCIPPPLETLLREAAKFLEDPR